MYKIGTIGRGAAVFWTFSRRFFPFNESSRHLATTGLIARIGTLNRWPVS
jgi:hypothetical protein